MKPPPPPSGRMEALYEWVGTLILSLICVIFAFIFIFRIVGVVGPSMEPTLIGGKTVEDRSGDRLLVYTLFYTPQRGDIVIIDRYGDDPLVKRVIAVGGDRVQILQEGGVRLNGTLLEEDFTSGLTLPHDFGIEERVVPAGYLLVLGDHRDVSKDSRSRGIGENGFVSEKDVIGKAVFRFAPLDRFGIVG